MVASVRNILLRPIGWLPFEGLARRIGRLLSRSLRRQMEGEVTDLFLQLLLGGMDLLFELSGSLREEIAELDATYVFAAKGEGSVGATAVFRGGDMRVLDEPVEAPTVRVTFRSSGALRRFLFSRDQDILNSLLENDVQVEGNLNYLYKFGHMAREILDRLGLGPMPDAAGGAEEELATA